MQILKQDMIVDNEFKLAKLLSSEGQHCLSCNNIYVYSKKIISDQESAYQLEIIEMDLADDSLKN